MKTAHTSIVGAAYVEGGPANGRPVVLMDDVHAYDAVGVQLAGSGYPALVPYLRGFGPTRFRNPVTPRSGQQPSLGHDLLDLINALNLRGPVLVGYDWGGRAAYIAAALWPERVGSLVSITGHNIQNIANAGRPQAPAPEYRYWYQLHTTRSRAGLSANRRLLCRLVWSLNYRFSDADYTLTPAPFDNLDFVEAVIQSYRHHYGNAPGVPAYDASEAKLATQLQISVTTIVLHGEADGVGPAAGSPGHARHFIDFYERRVISLAGLFLPRETPEAVLAAINELTQLTPNQLEGLAL